MERDTSLDSQINSSFGLEREQIESGHYNQKES